MPLGRVADAVGDQTKLLFDSGVRGGLDIVRALHEGADFVFAGHPFLYGVSALDEAGAAHVADIFFVDLKNAMMQLGCRELSDIAGLTAARPTTASAPAARATAADRAR